MVKSGTADNLHGRARGPLGGTVRSASVRPPLRTVQHCLRTALATASICATVALLLMLFPGTPYAQDAQASPFAILYPKHQASVGRRVNVVLDPMTDWTSAPFFQVRAGSTTYPVIDTASGRHALQGIVLEPGMNTITVTLLAPAQEKAKRENGYRAIASRTIAVFSSDGGFSVVPAPFTDRFFHVPEQETLCAGCHRMEAGPEDRAHVKPEDVLCYSCHREIPTGKHVHGPAAVWDCLACHDPGQRPVRYQFGSRDPWRIERSSSPLMPAKFTVSGSALFVRNSATLLSDAVPPGATDRAGEVRRRKDQERALFQSFLEHLTQNPGEQVLVEAHVDKAPLARRGKFRTHQQLTSARARAVEKLLRTYGISGKGRVVLKGMGSALPRTRGASSQDRELNDRIELVAYPPDAPVSSSQHLPSHPDRELVILTVGRAAGNSPIGTLTVIEPLPPGASYVRGSGTARGAHREPVLKGNELRWTIDRPGSAFQERITYVLRTAAAEAALPGAATRVQYTEGGRTQVREMGAEQPSTAAGAVQNVCARCHGNSAAGPFTHGPVAAGYCTICHDPHASPFSAWTRMESWELCTTCHGEKRADHHLIHGRGAEVYHPTRRRPDPLRPGKTLSCESCHSPHNAATRELLIFEVREAYDLCRFCHKKK